MSNLFLTLVIAFVIIVLAIACLAIGWLITGKTKIERGACGRDPTQKRDENCQSACNLCEIPNHQNTSSPTYEQDQRIEETEESEDYPESPPLTSTQFPTLPDESSESSSTNDSSSEGSN